MARAGNLVLEKISRPPKQGKAKDKTKVLTIRAPPSHCHTRALQTRTPPHHPHHYLSPRSTRWVNQVRNLATPVRPFSPSTARVETMIRQMFNIMHLACSRRDAGTRLDKFAAPAARNLVWHAFLFFSRFRTRHRDSCHARDASPEPRTHTKERHLG
jgi:hypothetical protein